MTTETTMKLEGVNILHIDDDPAFLEIMSSELSEEGAKVFSSYRFNKIEILNTVRKENIDLILFDLLVGQKNNFELLEELRREIPNPDFPIIVLTGKNDRITAEKVIDSGGNDCVTKDFSMVEIVGRIRVHYKAYQSKTFNSKVKSFELILNLYGQLLHEINNPVQIISCQIFKFREDKKLSEIGLDRIEVSLNKISQALEQLDALKEQSGELSKKDLKYKNFNSITSLLANYGLVEHEIQIKDNYVLFVDDDLDVLEAIKTMLGDQWGKNFKIAANGLDALKICEEFPIDLVISDLKMPGMTGIEFIKTISSKKLAKKIIVMTAYVDPETKKEVGKLEVVKILRKPFDLDELGNIINDLSKEKSG